MTPMPESEDFPAVRVAPEEVLRWCAAASPELWFPSAAAVAHGVPREALQEPLRVLRQAHLVAVVDWVPGCGQGYRLTAAGERAAQGGGPVTQDPPPTPPPAGYFPPLSGLSRNDRALITREAFLNPRAAIISPALILACVAWFAAGILVAWRWGTPVGHYLRDGDSRILIKLGAIYGPELLRGEWWRLLAAGFVHVGAIHLLVNMFSLAVMGPIAEGLWGRKRFIVLYFVSGLGASCGASLLSPDVVTAGASGSLWGLQSAVIVWLLRFREHLPPALFAEWIRRILFVTVINVVISLAPSVSWQGHFAGGLAGFASGVFLDWARWGSGRRRYVAGVLGLVALVVGCLGGLWAGSYSLGEWKALRQKAVPLAPQRATLDPAFVEAFEGMQPARCAALVQSATIAALSRDAGRESAALQRARAQSARLRLYAKEVRDRLAPEPPAVEMRAYLDAVEALADRLAAMLAGPAAPSEAQLAAVGEALRAVNDAWQQVLTAGAKPPR